MTELSAVILFLILAAVTIAFFIGMINPKLVVPWLDRPTKVDVLMNFLLVATILAYLIAVVALIHTSTNLGYADYAGIAFLSIILLVVLVVLGMIRPILVVHWGHNRNRLKVLLYYGTPVLIALIALIALRPIMRVHDQRAALEEVQTLLSNVENRLAADQGLGCGAYYIANWGKPPYTVLRNSSIQPFATYNECTLYHEAINISWGTLYKRIIFVERQLQAVTMIARSPSLSIEELFNTVMGPCFRQYGMPEKMSNNRTVFWPLINPDTGKSIGGIVVTIYDTGILITINQGGSESKYLKYLKYLGTEKFVDFREIVGII